MQKLNTKGEYKELLQWNRGRFQTINTNSAMLSNLIEGFIEENRVFYKKYENGLVFFVDEGNYYNLYYFWGSGLPLDDFRQEKPVIIEELNSAGRRDAYLNRFRPFLEAAGFSTIIRNLQVDTNLTSQADFLKEEYARRVESLNARGFTLSFCDTEDAMAQVVDLWKKHLAVADVPKSHMVLNADAKILNVLDHNGKVAATQWWQSKGSNTEGRHTVTHPDYYRNGLAAALLIAWFKDALDNGSSRAIGWVNENNLSSQSMLKKVGFQYNGKESIQFVLE